MLCFILTASSVPIGTCSKIGVNNAIPASPNFCLKFTRNRGILPKRTRTGFFFLIYLFQSIPISFPKNPKKNTPAIPPVTVSNTDGIKPKSNPVANARPNIYFREAQKRTVITSKNFSSIGCSKAMGKVTGINVNYQRNDSGL